jgi:4-amino-4-deoxy-L-arabinose transferase-like glycosyltransferase
LLNATLLFGIGAVTMTPDTPLLFFWVAAIAALARLSEGRHGIWFVVAGACIGLAGASKYTAAMLALGAGLWVLAVPDLRRRLAGPWPWLGTLAVLVPLLPVVWWNAAHGWASFAKQGGRTADFHPARAAQFLAELVFGQAGLATPLVFAFCVGGLVLAARRSWTRRSPGWMLLAASGLPPVLLFLEHATGDRVQGNWPAIIYPAAAIAATGLSAPAWRRLRFPAIALGLVLTGLVYVQAIWAPLPLPVRRDPLARQLAGWQGLADAVQEARLRSGADFVATDQYGVAGELALDLPPAVPVLAVEARWALFALPAANPAGQPGLLVRSERHRDPPDPADWTVLAPAGTAARRQDGATVETYRLYLVTRRPGGTAAAFMPRPWKGYANASSR